MSADLVKEAVREHWGERCPDLDADCACCQAWAEFDRIEALEAELASRPDRASVVGWQNIASAPGDEETPVLLWISGQCAVGLTWKRRDGTIIGKASMFGNSTAEFWAPLPQPPALANTAGPAKGGV